MSNPVNRPSGRPNEIARWHNTMRDALGRANNLQAPNRNLSGNPLEALHAQARHPQTALIRASDVFTPEAPRPGGAADRTWRDPDNQSRVYAPSNGVPLYNQGDPAWKSLRLGGTGTVSATSSNSIQKKGCAISAAAMAVSALSGRTITPREMDRYLDRSGGYEGNNVIFGRTGGVTGGNPRITATRQSNLSVNEIDRQLAQGRPVVIGVTYDSVNRTQTDHWITLTGKNADGSYSANDPNRGVVITLRREGGNGLTAPRGVTPNGRSYHFRNQAVTFSGGTPVRANLGNGQDSFTARPANAQAGATSRPQTT
ncbi:C39 family peptidase [Corallococcus macrosporus]|uniref:C39 family peptidase n=1 Tax=Corallococcus macrosporus TaxID=35 RepID=UPI0009E61EB0|nr:C39 family peptidase [Corallococcus macrosporus]